MNRAVYAAATKQCRIRGINNGVDFEFGDVALVGGEFGHLMSVGMTMLRNQAAPPSVDHIKRIFHQPRLLALVKSQRADCRAGAGIATGIQDIALE